MRTINDFLFRTSFVALLVLAFWLWPSIGLAGEAPRAKPNILIILADDLGYADVGFQGCKDIPTPNLDRLAARSLRCTNGYVSHPFCSPTRAGLLTGRYQQRFGHENNPAWLPEDDKVGLPLSQRTLADLLRSVGYRTKEPPCSSMSKRTWAKPKTWQQVNRKWCVA